jgi:hypothetical protein
MTRFAWVVKISAGLFAACVSGCTHTAGMSIKPAADKTSMVGVSEAQGPKLPVDAVGVEETQAAPPEATHSPETIRSPFGTTSLLTTGPELGKADKQPSATDILIATPLSPAGLRAPPEAVLGAAQTAPRTEKKPEQPIVLAVRSLLNDNYEEALGHLKNYDPATQEALICLMATLVPLTKKKLDQLSQTEIDALQNQVQKSLAALRPRARLLIDKMCFCEDIRGYGDYTPRPPDYEFQPKTSDRYGEFVQLYVELRNLTSEPRGGIFVTQLHSTMKILDLRGHEVYKCDLRNAEFPFHTLTPLPASYKQYGFYVPLLPPGKYRFCLEVRDVTRPEVERVASESLEFRVAAVGGS